MINQTKYYVHVPFCEVTQNKSLPYIRKITENIRENKGSVVESRPRAREGRSLEEGAGDVIADTHLKHGVFTTDLSSGFAVSRGSSEPRRLRE